MTAELDRWRMLPAFLVRSSGFAYGRLARLRFTRSIAAASELAVAANFRIMAGTVLDQVLSEQRYRDHPAFDEPAARKLLSRHIKRTRAFARGEHRDVPEDSLAETARVIPRVAGTIAQLRRDHEAQAAAARTLRAVFEAELAGKRGELQAIYADDDRLREAVFLESSESFERLHQLLASAGPRDVRARQRERLAAMYLQRFCAKNDTNSMCGPHAIGWLRERPVVPRIAIEAEGERRRSYFSHWAAARLLQETCQRAGAPSTAIRLNPTARVDGATAAWCTIDHDATSVLRRRYGRADLPVPALRVLELLALQPRSDAELVHLGVSELGVTADELAELLDELCRVGLAVRRPTLPPGLFRPLDAVIAMLDRWPSGEPKQWGQAHAGALRDLLDAFAAADLPARLTIYRQMVDRYRTATGDTGERGQGRHYADRTIVHEDCHAAVRAELGPELTEPLLTALAPLIHAASVPFELARETVRQWFRERFGERRRVPAIEAHRAFDDERAVERVAQTAAADALRDGIDRIRACFDRAAADAQGGPVRVPAAELAAAAGDASTARPGYLSIDVMLCARPGALPEIVLGEVHGLFWLPTCLLDVVPEPDRAEVLAEMRRAMRDLAGGRPTVECLFAHTQATDRRFALADADLLIIDPGDRPAVRFGQLDLMLDGDVFRFLDGSREVVPVTTYTRYPFLLYTSQLAPLIDDFVGRFFPESLLPESLRSGDTPRMLIDGVTFRRRSWRRSAGELQAMLGEARDETLLVRAQELRARLGCPAAVFAMFSGEPKPVHVDFDSFFLIETFAHLLARQPADATVRISEMLPGPDELFATAPDGPRTAELRMGLYRLGA